MICFPAMPSWLHSTLPLQTQQNVVALGPMPARGWRMCSWSLVGKTSPYIYGLRSVLYLKNSSARGHRAPAINTPCATSACCVCFHPIADLGGGGLHRKPFGGYDSLDPSQHQTPSLDPDSTFDRQWFFYYPDAFLLHRKHLCRKINMHGPPSFTLQRQP